MNSIEKEKAERLRMYNERLKNGQPLTEICPDISNCFQKYS
jgi:Ca2+-binding EF-hand superfamily protein